MSSQSIVGTKPCVTKRLCPRLLPILDEDTEFAMKWGRLFDIQLQEGLRDPIICYEFMNRLRLEGTTGERHESFMLSPIAVK